MIGIDLSDKMVLVCGAGAGGVGSATSLLLAKAGASIAAVDLSQTLVDETKRAVEAAGGTCFPFVQDLTDAPGTAALVERVLAEVKKIDLLVNVAGGVRTHHWAGVESMTAQVWHESFALNLDYVFQICSDVARTWIGRGSAGAIVNVASVSGLRAAPRHAGYGAAKAGLMALTKTMAVEWAKYGIRVNAIAPGNVITPTVLAYASRENFAPQPDGRRSMEPEEIAEVALLLLSDLARGVSGQIVAVDAGLSVAHPSGGLDLFQNNVGINPAK